MIDGGGGGGGSGSGVGEEPIGGSVSFRRVTAICYLRGAGSPWKPSDGGVLRLYPPAETGGVDSGGAVQGGKVTFTFRDQEAEAGDCQRAEHLPAGGTGGEGEGFIDVSPRAGRAVVFFSGAVEHEVLPVTGALPRAAVTTWFH